MALKNFELDLVFSHSRIHFFFIGTAVREGGKVRHQGPCRRCVTKLKRVMTEVVGQTHIGAIFPTVFPLSL